MGHSKSDIFYSGTSGLVLPVANKQMFPPGFQDKSRLTYYASLFNSLEVNSSFYKVPMASTVRKWAESVPDNFCFTFKLWKEITHVKGLAFDPEAVARFMDTIGQVGNKKGCLLVQFPPGLRADTEQLGKLLTAIKQSNTAAQWKVAVEFRNNGWYRQDIYDMLHHYHACMVAHDMAASATPILETHTNFVYLRFHGTEKGYRGSYSNDFLYEQARYIKDWQNEGKEVYVYFNNTVGDAIKNLMTLNDYLNMKG